MEIPTGLSGKEDGDCQTLECRSDRVPQDTDRQGTAARAERRG